ncbi:sodium-translocating pyrophosphatase [Clostridium thermosuccinogenes]|uniref:K(+)-insensitive pyrophosphate-energized proton pump n=1 Tax=Clostridium thermosuccinogenes TaxID=84032 RepID=A0A2K2FRZ2_9CLOT|nr:sodium-translocating pyrophosphatase [Pseudoclostridium thermosuccinogenes]AUS97909.1 sodium-translocating pyrophosphatase [Pseudoclostridium thermosuccinogenes]PNT94197.1 sodium-translocating pyrophosphatase [Pseudoclostridium thermosuccinogenes]PNU00206.1 sodium-translocating pyrophosphatase [Pseudoclostridium thermosuccinogenes]PNU01530.1 sodium-translocating pyrophosphatase [Pseudoclostridium thermosuccinogenes]
MDISTALILAIVVSLLSFGVAAYFYIWVKKQPSSNKTVHMVGELIQKGASTFLRREYALLARFAGVIAILILLFLPQPIWSGDFKDNIAMAVSYIFGTALSALAGKIGITIATIANMKAAEAATKGIKPSFLAGFRGGAVMGMAVVGSSLLGVSLVYAITRDASAMLGFSFGASSLALFAKAGGGIYTKTADVSADLVGKVELGIPEDDPRNPAVIADNVGDNVGDVAGMGADLFDSNVASMVAALVMAITLDKGAGNFTMMVFVYAALGLLASSIGVITARMGKSGDPSNALNMSTYVTTALYAGATALVTWIFKFEWRIWGAMIAGLLVGTIIGIASDYFTNDNKKPVHYVAKASESGPAFTILSGVSYGFLSVLPALAGIAVSALVAYNLTAQLNPGNPVYGMFGISMAAVGMLSIVGMIISNDAYGPIVDNARGLVEMGNLGDKALEITDSLDSAGNTVKAVTKGFAIGAAGLTIIALLGTFMSEVNVAASERGLAGIENFDILNPTVFFGLLVGAAIPAVFSAMLMLGVDRNAQRMVGEIHRQFNEIPGLKEGKEDAMPEYDKCIDIATTGALKELIPAGLMAIAATIVVGFVGGVNAVGGFLAGNIISGLLLALFMSNSGGLWDNAKKYVEAGNHGGKGSNAHKSAVVGDTVGDPFKDTAGPSINTQVTVVSLVSSIMATLFLTIKIFG